MILISLYDNVFRCLTFDHAALQIEHWLLTTRHLRKYTEELQLVINMLTVACMCDCFAIWRSGASTWLCSLNSRLCRWMVKLNMQLGQMTVQMRVEHSTKFIFYVTCMCKQGQTCRNEGWNTVQYSFVMQLVWMTLNLCRWGYNIHLLCLQLV